MYYRLTRGRILAEIGTKVLKELSSLLYSVLYIVTSTLLTDFTLPALSKSGLKLVYLETSSLRTLMPRNLYEFVCA